MTILHPQHAPDLIRGLCREKAPARGPGRVSLFVNRNATRSGHGAFCLYHGVASGRSHLHRAQFQPARSGRAASQWGHSRPYAQIQDQDAGLVRSARRVFCQPFARTSIEALATEMEGRVDCRRQSGVARYYHGNFRLSRAEAPDHPGSPRIQSGAGGRVWRCGIFILQICKGVLP